jgi:hypothetical protein
MSLANSGDVALIIGVGAVMAVAALWTIIAPRSVLPRRHRRAGTPVRLGGALVLAAVLIGGWHLIAARRADQAEAAEAARKDMFHAERARVAPVRAASSSGQGGGQVTVNIFRYIPIDPKRRPPAYLADLPDLPAGTNLLLVVDGALKPDSVTMVEKPGEVTITLSGGCAPPPVPPTVCDATTGKASLMPGYPVEPVNLVPVTLSAPLGTRRLIDGTTHQAVTVAG